MNIETDVESRHEPLENAEGVDDSKAAALGMEATEFPFYIVPRPPVPGKTGWSIAAW